MNISDSAVDVSVIIGFKDWGEDRLFMSIQSIFKAFGKYNGEVIVSDYGSSALDVAIFKERVEKSGARYVRTESDGHWSRSRAINIGYSVAKGSVLIATDADMLFSPGSLGLVTDEVLGDENLAVVLQCRDLPFGYSHEEIASDSIDWDELSVVSQIRPRWGMGGMFAARRERVELVGGYDNRMHTYGGEDLDFALRVRRSGCALKWIENPRVRMFHIWHPPTIASVENEEGGKEAIQQNRDILYKDRTWKRSYAKSEWDITTAPPVFHVLYHYAPETDWQMESIKSILEQRNCNLAITVLNTSAAPLDVSQAGISQIDVTPAGLSAKVAELVAGSRSPFIVFIEGGAILRPDALARTAELMDVDYGGVWPPLLAVEPDTGAPRKPRHEASTETETPEGVVFRNIFVVSRVLVTAVPLHGSSWEDLTTLLARDLESSGAAFIGGPEFVGISMTGAAVKPSTSLLAWRHRGTPGDLSITTDPDLPAGTTMESFIARLLPPGILLTDVVIEALPGMKPEYPARVFPEDAAWIRITDGSGSIVSLKAHLFGVSAADLERFEAEGFLVQEVVRSPARRALSTLLLPDDVIDTALKLAREEQITENRLSGAMAFCHGIGTSVPADIAVAQERGARDMLRIVESSDAAIWFWVRECNSMDEIHRVRDLWRAASKAIVSSGFIVAGGVPAGVEIMKKIFSTGGSSIEI